MPTYELRRGTFRREDGVKLEPGQTVELPAERVERHADEKFSRVTDDDAGEPEPESETESDESQHAAADDASTDEASDGSDGSLPSDYEALRALAVVYEGDEVNGNSSKEAIVEFFEDWPMEDLAALAEEA